MIDQVRGLGDELLVRLRHRGERNFEAFLADLLRDAFRTCGIQPRRVASLRALGNALRDDGFEGAEKGQAGGGVITEAGGGARMTNRAGWAGR